MPSNGVASGGVSIGSKWANGALQWFNRATGAVIATLNPASFIRNLTLTTIASQNAAPTAAQLLGGLVAHTTVTAGGTFTVPTGTDLDAAIPDAVQGYTFECLLANNGTQTSTVTAATGCTLAGTAAITTGKTARLIFYRTGTAATWVCYIVASA